MNELNIFKTEEYGEVRTKVIEGKPYFCLADLCRALELENPAKVKTRLNEKGVTSSYTLTPGGKQQMIFVDEGNLYKTIFQSRKPEAERFSDWVTHEVLPQIRATGGYHLPQTYADALRALADKAEEAERLRAENEDMLPKAEYFDELVDRNLLTNFRDTAKELQVGERRFIAFLKAKRFIYRDARGKLRPYAEKNKGLFELKEFNARHSDHTDLQTLITPRGRETFRLLLKKTEETT